MQAWPMPSCGVCVSVRPSVRHIRELCQNEASSKTVSPSGSQTILVFLTVRSTFLAVVGAVVYHSCGARLFTAQRPPRVIEYAEEK